MPDKVVRFHARLVQCQIYAALQRVWFMQKSVSVTSMFICTSC